MLLEPLVWYSTYAALCSYMSYRVHVTFISAPTDCVWCSLETWVNLDFFKDEATFSCYYLMVVEENFFSAIRLLNFLHVSSFTHFLAHHLLHSITL